MGGADGKHPHQLVAGGPGQGAWIGQQHRPALHDGGRARRQGIGEGGARRDEGSGDAGGEGGATDRGGGRITVRALEPLEGAGLESKFDLTIYVAEAVIFAVKPQHMREAAHAAAGQGGAVPVHGDSLGVLDVEPVDHVCRHRDENHEGGGRQEGVHGGHLTVR